VTNERRPRVSRRDRARSSPSNLKIVPVIFQCQRRQVPRAPPRVSPVVRPGTNKSGRTPGGARGGNTIQAGDQRTRYKLKQISRVIIINPQRALIIGPPTRGTRSTPALAYRDYASRWRCRITIFARKLIRLRDPGSVIASLVDWRSP